METSPECSRHHPQSSKIWIICAISGFALFRLSVALRAIRPFFMGSSFPPAAGLLAFHLSRAEIMDYASET
ncbi:MAG TPA: hypothetical protein VIM57_08050, partial [Luteolibacter sp.]